MLVLPSLLLIYLLLFIILCCVAGGDGSALPATSIRGHERREEESHAGQFEAERRARPAECGYIQSGRPVQSGQATLQRHQKQNEKQWAASERQKNKVV